MKEGKKERERGKERGKGRERERKKKQLPLSKTLNKLKKTQKSRPLVRGKDLGKRVGD